MPVLGIDRDPDAIARGQKLAAQFEGRLTLVRGDFSDLDTLVEGQTDGVVLDLGVSSFQFDQAERGFSFRDDGPLDMRMSLTGLTAADFVNTADEKELARIIATFGEERHARRIARAIIAARPIDAHRTTGRDRVARAWPGGRTPTDPSRHAHLSGAAHSCE